MVCNRMWSFRFSFLLRWLGFGWVYWYVIFFRGILLCNLGCSDTSTPAGPGKKFTRPTSDKSSNGQGFWKCRVAPRHATCCGGRCVWQDWRIQRTLAVGFLALMMDERSLLVHLGKSTAAITRVLFWRESQDKRGKSKF